MQQLRSRWILDAVAPLALAAMVFGWGASDGSAQEQPGWLPLWEVTDGNDTVHLLGSIHLLRPEVYPLDPAIHEVFDAAEVVVFEIDLADATQAQGAMFERGMLAGGATIAELLPADLAEEVERNAEALSLPMVRGMKPWLAAMVLPVMAMQQAGYQGSAGIDLHFHQRADSAGKRVIGLETMEEQIDALDGLSDEAQVAFLRRTLVELDSITELSDRLTLLWEGGDTDGLAAMMTESMREQAELEKRLLDDRNRRWVPQIEALLRGGARALVIVGVGHLVGEGSVVDLLQKRGYTVQKLRAAREAAGVGAAY